MAVTHDLELANEAGRSVVRLIDVSDRTVLAVISATTVLSALRALLAADDEVTALRDKALAAMGGNRPSPTYTSPRQIGKEA